MPDTPNAQLHTSLKDYARLIVSKGCNLKAGQELLLSISTDCVEFARILTAEAYAQGARRVTVRFGDEKIARLHFENCALEVFESFPEWQALLNNSMAREGAAILSVISEDPLALVGIDQQKLVANTRSAYAACKEFHDLIDQGKVVWCIVGAAAPGWASKVFPSLPADEATGKLWEAIFKAMRLDAKDPQKAWEEHRKSFNERKQWLNAQRFDSLRFTSSLGTDLIVGLNEKGIWQGGGDVTVDGWEFFPNMPTEEVFTTPDRLRADGIVFSSMPLIHHGCPIEDFSIIFKDGKAVDCTARVGQDVLEAIFTVDEHAARLGECALVPWSSPIQQSGILYYNTLYDENASCHLAIGQGFPDCLEGGQSMDEEELVSCGVNKSATHVDFMIGTKDMSIIGIKKDGIEVAVFCNGNWAG